MRTPQAPPPPPPRSRPSAPEHLLRLRAHAEAHSLGLWAARYLSERVVGGAANTLEAKARDLATFVDWFVATNGHGEVAAWLVRDTRVYLTALERRGRSPATVNRALATLRHFARYVHEQPGGHFARGGVPVVGVRELATDEPDCRKLDAREMHRLFKAADQEVASRQHGRARPRRNRAMLALLYFTGLRVQELVALTLRQRQGPYLVDVARKGRVRSRQVYLPAECRHLLDDYLAEERPRDLAPADTAGAVVVSQGPATAADATPIFLVAGPLSRPLVRQDVARALARIAQVASTGTGGPVPIHLHPHRLRHTFGAAYRDRSGSDTETAAALGHTGLKYVGRYVRRSQAERDRLAEGLYEAPDAGAEG